MGSETLRNFIRGQILLKTLPLTLLFCSAKVVIHHQHWEIGKFDIQLGSLLAATTFILAFILNGTLIDYRTSDDIPNQIVNAIETIQDTNLFMTSRHPEHDPNPLKAGLVKILESVIVCLEQEQPLSAVSEAITQLNPLFVPLSKFCEPPLMARVQGEQAKLRLLLDRIQSVRDSGFLPPTYTLLNLLLVASCLALLITYGDEFKISLLVSGFLFMSFLYLLLLIYDLDNPFEYRGKSSADINLSVLQRSLHQFSENSPISINPNFRNDQHNVG